LSRIADGDPINRVNLLYTIDADRIHRIERTRFAGSFDPDPVCSAAPPGHAYAFDSHLNDHPTLYP
jgi:hypothetical protein